MESVKECTELEELPTPRLTPLVTPLVTPRGASKDTPTAAATEIPLDVIKDALNGVTEVPRNKATLLDKDAPRQKVEKTDKTDKAERAEKAERQRVDLKSFMREKKAERHDIQVTSLATCMTRTDIDTYRH